MCMLRTSSPIGTVKTDRSSENLTSAVLPRLTLPDGMRRLVSDGMLYSEVIDAL